MKVIEIVMFFLIMHSGYEEKQQNRKIRDNANKVRKITKRMRKLTKSNEKLHKQYKTFENLKNTNSINIS